MAEGTETTLQTDDTFTVTAQNIGNYKPGATILSGEVYAPNRVSFCYVLRQGVILGWLVPNKIGVTNREQMLSAPIRLRPGDTVRVLVLAASSRNAALCVKTASGISRIFIGTPSGAGTTNLLDLQDGTSIGDVLQGQTVTQAVFLLASPEKISNCGGAVIRNASGQLAGAVPASDPVSVEPMISNVNIPIALNFTATVITGS